MDDDASNMRNWGYYEPSFKGHLSLQLMSSMAERDTKPFVPGRDPTVMVSADGAYHPRDCVVSDAQLPMNYTREIWVNQRDRFLNIMPANPNYGAVLPETSGAHSLQILQPPEPSRDERVGRIEEPVVPKEVGTSKKRQGGGAPKAPKVKKPRKAKDNTNPSVPRVKPAKKSLDVVINRINMDISGIPIPVCSCTGAPQQCYRWGCGACCKNSWKKNESGCFQEGVGEACS